MIRKILALGLMAGCTMPTATPTNSATQYTCADGAKVLALYGQEAGQDSVLLTIGNETVTLLSEIAASGVRYGWPSDGSNYVWWTKGDMATLYWKDGSKSGAEIIVHADCKQQ